MFTDHAKQYSGDVFEFVRRKYSLKTKSEAANRILSDLKRAGPERIKFDKPIQKEHKIIKIKSREWKNYDLWWWAQFGITPETLNKFDVSPISHFFLNEEVVMAEPRAYAYREYKDNVVTYKIYQPESKVTKWLSNVNKTVHQGYTKLPVRGELLIITKALKDVMSLHDTLGIPAVGLQAESVPVKMSVINEYKSRFKRVVVLFDSDIPGRNASAKFSAEYDLEEIIIPFKFGCKDYSDLVKNLSEREAKGIMVNILR
jgi:hypothetical protein